jgi:4-amino-4-deoxy-L-arabinose transferase-like glycosyltransferase
VKWVEEDNYYGAVYSQGAHNNLRAGLAVTAGVPAPYFFGALPIPPRAYYVHHPVLMPLLVTASFALFGELEWAAKLVSIVCSLASALLLWLLVSEAIGRRGAALVVACFVTLPMELHYGDMVDFEPSLVMWMLAALFALRRWDVTGGRYWASIAVFCFAGAVWTDWPGYLFIIATTFWLLRRKERASRWLAIVLLAVALISGVAFLLQIRFVNPEAWHDLWTAVKMRLGSGVQPGSSDVTSSAGVRFGFGEWVQRIFASFGQDYLLVMWLFVLAGFFFLIRNRSAAGFRWLGWAALLMAAAGIPYMLLLRNWSFIHDYASFSAIGSIAILGGLGLESGWLWMERRTSAESFRRFAAVITTGLLVWLAFAGFARAEEQRSQLLMLDGVTREPPNLIPDLGRYLANTFPAETTILCNFDPYYSTLGYYAQRPLVNNLSSAKEWDSAVTAAGGTRIGGMVWLAAPSAAEILESLPVNEIVRVDIDGVQFALWKPGR